jgi:GNAT superfamily N-acetyltransferase
MTSSKNNDPHRIVSPEAKSAPVLAEVTAQAFMQLPASRFLVPDAVQREQLFPGYFLCDVEDTMRHGTAYALANMAGVALWMPVPPEGYPAPELDPRVVALDADLAERNLIFHKTLLERHPVGTNHHHLMIIAVKPDQQRRGGGSNMLRAHHQYLDTQGLPAYLEAASLSARDLYRRHGYVELGDPLTLPDGSQMHPMWREPGDPEH